MVAISESDAHVDSPEFLNRVESDDLFEEVIPVVALMAYQISYQPKYIADTITHFPTRWFGEPQRPLIHQRVLDVEVFRVVKDCDLLITGLGGFRRSGLFEGDIVFITTIRIRVL